MTTKTEGALRALFEELNAKGQRTHLSTFRKTLAAAGRKLPAWAEPRKPGPKASA
jgi:hypothetical protein